MSEESTVYLNLRLCNETKCQSKGNDRNGIHQLSDYHWVCDKCYQARLQASRLIHSLLDWSNKNTVNNLDEAVNYFTWLQGGRNWKSLFRYRSIQGHKGNICHIVELTTEELDSFQNLWPKKYAYYICYNREYLPGYKALHAFERPSKSYGNKDWQTVHSKIIADAIANYKKYQGVRIVVIMQSKNMWYIDPLLIRKWADEYECERIPPGEIELECSIPVTKLEDYDVFRPQVVSKQLSTNVGN